MNSIKPVLASVITSAIASVVIPRASNVTSVSDLFSVFEQPSWPLLINLGLIAFVLNYIITPVLNFAPRHIPPRFHAQGKDDGDEIVTTSKLTLSACQDVQIPEEKPHDSEASFSIPVLMLYQTVSSSASSYSALFDIDTATLNTKAPLLRMMSKYQFCRHDVLVRVSVNGNPSATGLLIVGAIPTYYGTPSEPQSIYYAGFPNVSSVAPYAASAQYGNLQEMKNKVYIDVSKSAEYEFLLPYRLPYEFLTTTYMNGGWRFAGAYVTQVSTPPGATTAITLSVWMSAVNIVGRGNAPFSQGLFSYTPIYMDHINAESLPLDVKGDSVSATFMDVPSNPSNPKTLITGFFQKLFGNKAVLDTTVTTTNTNQIVKFSKKEMKLACLAEDEMAISFFRGIDTDIFSTVITTATARGALLFSLQAIPFPNTTYTGLSEWENVYDAIYVSSKVLSHFYEYWSGDLIFKIYLAGNKFMSAKILISFLYNTQTTAVAPTLTSTGYIDPNSGYTAILDTSSDQPFYEIRIPYASQYPYMRTWWNANNSAANVPIGVAYSLGTLNAYLLNSLVNSNNSSNGMAIQVTMRWADNFQLYNHKSVPLKYNSQADQCSKEMQIRHLNGADIFRTAMIPAVTLKDWITKPTFYATLQMPALTEHSNEVGTANIDTPRIVMPIRIDNLRSSPEWSFLLSTFCACKGSLRLVVRCLGAPVNNYRVYVIPPVSINNLQNPGVLVAAPLSVPNNLFANAYSTSLAGNLDPATNMQGGASIDSWSTPDSIQYVGGASATVSYFTNVITNYPYTIVGVNKPETIVEIHDPMMHLLHHSTLPMFFKDNISFYGYNYGYLAIVPMSTNITDTVSPQFTVEIMAGDDFRFMHYNGGPFRETLGGVGSFNTTASTYTALEVPKIY
jgi:hypothetical protein